MNKLLITIVLCFLYPSVAFGEELQLKYKFLFEADVTLKEPINIGDTPYGQRVIYPVAGGTFEGPELKGKILANGGDWLTRLDAKTSKLDVRAVFETSEGERVYTYYEGFIHNAEGDNYYFRTNPVFQTSSEKYSWLNHTIAVGVGKITDKGVAYKIYVIE